MKPPNHNHLLYSQTKNHFRQVSNHNLLVSNMKPPNMPVSERDLETKPPGGAYVHARYGPKVVGWHDGALSAPSDTGHASTPVPGRLLVHVGRCLGFLLARLQLLSCLDNVVTIILALRAVPLFRLGHLVERRLQAIQVVGQVTLIAHDLLVRIILGSALVAAAELALATRVVPTVLAVRGTLTLLARTFLQQLHVRVCLLTAFLNLGHKK